MNIYRIAMHDKANTDELLASSGILEAFAQFSGIGTWSKSTGLCKSCQSSSQTIIEPLLVQWEPSTDVIGDFSWDGPWGQLFLVTEPVIVFFGQHNFECKFLDVEYVPPEKKRPRYRQVGFPYKGPKQYWAKCETFVDLDLEASGVELKEDCPVCGVKDYTFRYDNIVIPRSNWHGEKMFRITTNGKSLATFVTEEGRELIESARFSNVAFRPAGEIVSTP